MRNEALLCGMAAYRTTQRGRNTRPQAPLLVAVPTSEVSRPGLGPG